MSDPYFESEEYRQEVKAGTTPAPQGQIWVCAICGKRARTRYGFDEHQKSTALDAGWDESCMLHAVLCHESPSGGTFHPVP